LFCRHEFSGLNGGTNREKFSSLAANTGLRENELFIFSLDFLSIHSLSAVDGEEIEGEGELKGSALH
jgi:hypothetical protein